MKSKIYFLFLSSLIAASCSQGTVSNQPVGPVDELPLENITITDHFWKTRIDNNYRVSVMEMLDKYEKAGEAPDPKLVEAAGYILQQFKDTVLQSIVDRGLGKLIDHVLPNGKPRAWKRLLNGEMYSAGHFMEAAVAYSKATGNKEMIDAAIKLADDIDANFGPAKRLDVSQHEEIKIGLLKLYHFTGNEKYMTLAKSFIDSRGYSNNGRELYGEYAQDHMPVIEQPEAVGHTVRATYLYTPLAEIAAITQDTNYIKASDRLWEDAVYKKTYLTGHIGTYRDHEDFGEAYELPNLGCWNETCASIGSVYWNQQLFSLHRDAKYIDMLERFLYNGVMSGVSLDGSKYFYQNPLKTYGGFERQPWFGPNCCPPNVTRLLASLGKYIYSKDGKNLYVNLFMGNSFKAIIDDKPVVITQETKYPWEGNVKIMVEPEAISEFTMYVRIPGWTGNNPMPGDLYRFLDQNGSTVELKLNGKKLKVEPVKGFVAISRNWKKGDVVELEIPMQIRKVVANEKVLDNAGMIALQRGPLVYCAEGVDNNGKVMNLYIPDNSVFEATYTEEILGGIVKLSGNVNAVNRNEDKVGTSTLESVLVAVPYFVWANRGQGEMSVWLPRDESGVEISPTPTIASASKVSSSCGTGSLSDNYPGGNVPDIATRFYPRAQSGSDGFKPLYDQIKPVNSFDGSSTYLTLRPKSGDRAWVQYDFNKPEDVKSVDVYWKDDKQCCQVPESWVLLYKSNGKWLPIKNLTEYTVDKDKFNTVTFESVKAEGMRMEIKLRPMMFRKGELGPPDGNYMPEDTKWYETGIIEWQVK